MFLKAVCILIFKIPSKLTLQILTANTKPAMQVLYYFYTSVFQSATKAVHPSCKWLQVYRESDLQLWKDDANMKCDIKM